MENITDNEILNGFKIFMLNPYTKIKSIIKEKKVKKQEKVLQMKLAIMSGGITKVK